MKVTRSIDIEEAIRLALSSKLAHVYVRPLPKDFEVPSVLIQQVGGTELNTIDTASIKLDARAETEAEASELLRTAIASLKKAINEGDTAIRFFEVNSSGSWGSDPVRPDLAMCTALLRVVAHQEDFN